MIESVDKKRDAFSSYLTLKYYNINKENVK